jgi:hypothetical protein
MSDNSTHIAIAAIAETGLLDAMAEAYEKERALWDLRHDLFGNFYQVARHHGIGDAEPDILAQGPIKDVADGLMRRMRRQAAMQAALQLLADDDGA